MVHGQCTKAAIRPHDAVGSGNLSAQRFCWKLVRAAFLLETCPCRVSAGNLSAQRFCCSFRGVYYRSAVLKAIRVDSGDASENDCRSFGPTVDAGAKKEASRKKKPGAAVGGYQSADADFAACTP